MASTFSAVGCFLGCFNSSTALGASYIGKPKFLFTSAIYAVCTSVSYTHLNVYKRQLDILDSQDISLKKQLEKDAAAFREEKFRPEPEQYTELLDTRIQIRPAFRDKLIEQLKGTFGKYYDYHRRDIAADEVDYLNVEDPDVFSHRAWELEYQRKQEMRRNQPVRSKKRSYDMEL